MCGWLHFDMQKYTGLFRIFACADGLKRTGQKHTRNKIKTKIGVRVTCQIDPCADGPSCTHEKHTRDKIGVRSQKNGEHRPQKSVFGHMSTATLTQS
jgi:hypothetical protein